MKVGVLDALGELGDAQNAAAIERYLSDEDEDVREAAVEASRKCHHEEVD